MNKLIIPSNYKSALSVYQTQSAIGFLRSAFEDIFAEALNLKRVSAPLFVEPKSGLNDDLSGIERAVEFDISQTGTNVQIVHSLAKWKRMALHKYGFPAGEGLYTDMNAIRRDEKMDNIHSVYVDQWDWEAVITESDRNEDFLKNIVTKIVNAICDAHEHIKGMFPQLSLCLSREVVFITSQQLEDLYPALTPKEREKVFCKQHKTVFVMQIGDVLKSAQKHDDRAPDYDDWTLNGDILFWNEILDDALEVSSMGIRVDSKALDEQLTKAGCNNRRSLSFHKMLLNNELPLTVGGGIGQSRVCMLLLEKAHIGEVQVSVWDDKSVAECGANGINLL